MELGFNEAAAGNAPALFVPPIDAAVPAKPETATFAAG